MSLSNTPFEKFDSDCQDAGSATALENLANYLVEKERLHELFEVRKLQLRQRLGLPIEKWQAIDELPSDKGQQLEAGLLDICREVGTRFLEAGEVTQGWQYLEPVGDRALLTRLVREVQVTDENVESLIHVTIGQGIEPELGFGLVLERFGTCSSITTYESQLAMQGLHVRRGPAAQLVNHLYMELSQRVRQAIEELEGVPPQNESLSAMISGRDALFEGLGHHIDTTHLASTIRISKIVDQPAVVDKAIELAEYGTRLHPDFQYQGQLPFENIYPETLEFLNALRGKDPDQAVARLQAAADAEEGATMDAAVWLVYLLDRLGRGREATEAYLSLVHEQQNEATASEDVCPNLMYLVSKYEQFDLARSELLRIGDLLGYATVGSIEQQRTGETA